MSIELSFYKKCFNLKWSKLNKPYFLYIIHNSGACLFSHNFKEVFEIFQKDLFSSFITAISIFSAELNKKLGYAKKFGRLPSIPLNMTFEIMISYKTPLIGALVVEKKDINDDMKTFLNELISEFLILYKENMEIWDGSIDGFEAFNHEIKRIYNKMELQSFQIPKIVEGYENYPNLNESYLTLMKEIDGNKSIKVISLKIGKNIDEIISMISNLLWLELITLSQKVYDYDIFEAKKDLFYLIRSSKLDPEKAKIVFSDQKRIELNLLEAIDGFKTVFNLSELVPNLTIHKIKQILSQYLMKGAYLEKVELYPQIIKIDEKDLNKMSTETLALAYSLENICDGELSLSEISNKTGAPIKEIKRILDLLGKRVIYKKRYLK